MKTLRQLTHKEKLIEKNYELKKWKILLNLIAKEIGQDKIIEIAKSKDYPKTKKEIIKMIKQGELINDLPRHMMFEGIINAIKDGCAVDNLIPYVKWSDIEKVIG